MNLLETAIHKLVAITNNGYLGELVELVKVDSNFRDSIIELEKLINVHYAFTTKSFNKDFLFSLKDIELDSLVKTFTLLEGNIEELTFNNRTPVPPLFSRLSDLDYDGFDGLVDWVFKNRTSIHMIPNGWDHFENIKSLREYKLHSELKRLKNELLRTQNNIRSIEKQIENPFKATNDLIDAISRGDVKSLDKLVSKGAEVYLIGSNGKTLKELIEDLKISNNNFGK